MVSGRLTKIVTARLPAKNLKKRQEVEVESDSYYYQTFTARLFSSIIDYPKSCWALLIALSVLAAGGYYDAKWPAKLRDRLTGALTASQSTELTASSDPMRPSRFRGGGGGGGGGAFGQADTLLVIESAQFFSYEGAEALRAIVVALEELPTVKSVTWMDNSPPLNIFGLPEPVVPKGRASEQRFNAAKEKAVKNPLIVGQFLSKDAQTTVMSIGFDWPFVHKDSDCSTAIEQTAQRAAADFPAVTMKFSTTGQVPIRLMLVADRAANEMKFQLIAYGIILLMAVILFRGITVVIVVALSPVIGVVWTLGFLRYFGLQDNPFSDVIVPVLVSLVGFTDAVHMMVFLRGQLRQGGLPVPACRKMLAAVGLACFLTSLTTAIGMGSLLLAHHEVVREFGWACLIGVTATWISVMLVIPLACYTPWAKWLSKGSDRSFIETNLNYFSAGVGTVLKHSRLVSYGAIVLLFFLTAIALQLRPDDRTSNLMPQGSQAQLTLAKLDQALGGLDVCRVQIDWVEQKQYTPEQIAQMISAVDQILDYEPLIGNPLSLCKLLNAMPGEAPPEEKMSLAELLPPPLKLAVYNPQNQLASVIFRVKDLGTATYKPVFERIQQKLEELETQYPKVSFTMTGGPIWKWRDLYQILLDMVTSLTSASIIIFGVLAIAFKSLRIGIISVLPNILPLAAAATVLVLMGQPLEMVSVCALTVCLGIAVDDTIHFVSRYQEEQRGQGTRREKIQRAFQGVGSGLIMTSVVLIAGFASVLTSNTPEHKTFALMGLVTISTALLGDLFLLPALLDYFDKDPVEKN
jgi:uncharacterized protein